LWIATTQIYTRVAIHKLKAIHDATHPGARLKRPAPREDAPSLAAGPSQPAAADRRAELLSALAAEAPDEEE
jgi:hypothetical protein